MSETQQGSPPWAVYDKLLDGLVEMAQGFSGDVGSDLLDPLVARIASMTKVVEDSTFTRDDLAVLLALAVERLRNED